MPVRLTVAAVILLAGTSLVRAAGMFLTGNDLYHNCTNAAVPMGWSLCLGYIEGVLDATNFEGSLSYGKSTVLHGIVQWCVPAGVTAGQARDVVIKFLRDKPEFRHLSAAEEVTAAVAAAWPCPRSD